MYANLGQTHFIFTTNKTHETLHQNTQITQNKMLIKNQKSQTSLTMLKQSVFSTLFLCVQLFSINFVAVSDC